MPYPKAAFTIFALACLFLTTACSSSPQGPDIDEGNWEISTKLEMADMPFAIPPVTYTMCLGKKDLIPQQEVQTQENNCAVTSQTVQGDSVSWTVVCDTPEGKSTSTGTITYKGDSFDGTMKVEAGGMPTMTQSMNGRRLGPCGRQVD
ncbi:DUF3617 domain-containing protein [Thiovibrio sp. JS02]